MLACASGGASCEWTRCIACCRTPLAFHHTTSTRRRRAATRASTRENLALGHQRAHVGKPLPSAPLLDFLNKKIDRRRSRARSTGSSAGFPCDHGRTSGRSGALGIQMELGQGPTLNDHACGPDSDATRIGCAPADADDCPYGGESVYASGFAVPLAVAVRGEGSGYAIVQTRWLLRHGFYSPAPEGGGRP